MPVNAPFIEGVPAVYSTVPGFAHIDSSGTQESIKSNLGASTAPTVTDDSDSLYKVGSTWIDNVTDSVYVCADATPGAAVWRNTSAGGGTVINNDANDRMVTALGTGQLQAEQNFTFDGTQATITGRADITESGTIANLAVDRGLGIRSPDNARAIVLQNQQDTVTGAGDKASIYWYSNAGERLAVTVAHPFPAPGHYSLYTKTDAPGDGDNGLTKRLDVDFGTTADSRADVTWQSVKNFYVQGPTSAVMLLEATSGDASFVIDSNKDGLGTETSYVVFRNNGANMWQIGKDTGNDFQIFDYTRNQTVLEVLDNADMYLMGAGGNVMIGTTDVPAGLFHVKQATGANLNAYLESVSDNVFLYLNSGTDALGAERSSLVFQGNGTNYWQIQKADGLHAFEIHDFTRAQNVLQVASNGDMSLMPAGGNVGVNEPTPINPLHITGVGNVLMRIETTDATFPSSSLFGQVITNSRKETQLQYDDHLLIFDKSATNTRMIFDDASLSIVIGNGVVTPITASTLQVYDSSGDTTLEITSVTDNALLVLDSGQDGLGDERSQVIFRDDGANRWMIEKNASDNFVLHHFASATDLLTVDNGSGFFGFGDPTPPGKISVAGNVSASAWGLTGIQTNFQAATYTDTSTPASGTATNAVFVSIGQPSLDATNLTVTTSNSSTLYVAGPPLGVGNNTITNPWSFWVDDGHVRLDGQLVVGAALDGTRRIRSTGGMPRFDAAGAVTAEHALALTDGAFTSWNAYEGSTTAAIHLQSAGGATVVAHTTTNLTEVTSTGNYLLRTAGTLGGASGNATLFVADSGKVTVGSNTLAFFGDGSTALDGKYLHVHESTANARIVGRGATGAFLDLLDTGGGLNDKHLQLEVDGGLGTFRSLNDDSTTLNDNILIFDLGSGLVTATDLTVTGVLTIPSGSAPVVDAAGELAHDSSITNLVDGKLVFYAGATAGEEMVVSIPKADTLGGSQDGFHVAYNFANGDFELVAAGSGGEWTLTSGIVHPNAAATNVTVGSTSGAFYNDGTTAITGQYVHVDEGTNEARLIARGNTGAFLDLLDLAGTANDGHIQLEVDGGVATFRSIADGGTTQNDNICVFDLGSGQTGFGAPPTDGQVHIQDGTAGAVAATAFSRLVVESSDGTATDVSILTSASSQGRLVFGRVGDNDAAMVRYNHSAQVMDFVTEGATAVSIDSQQQVGFGTNTPGALIDALENTDAASTTTMILRGNNRATAGPGDQSSIDFYLDNDASTSALFTRLTWQANNVGAATRDGEFRLGVMVNNSMTDRMTINETGVLATGLLDIVGVNAATTVLLTDDTTDAATKETKIGLRHFTNAEEPMALVYGQSATTTNTVFIGGGTSTFNTATHIVFYTAANATTVTGSERLRIQNTGDLLLGTTAAPSANSGKVMAFGDNGATNPTMGTNTAGLFAKDDAGTVRIWAIDEDGTNRQLTSAGGSSEWTLTSGVVSPNSAATNVSVGTSAAAQYGDDTTAIAGQWIHVLEGAGDASLVAKGSTGAFLHLIDSAGAADDKTLTLEVDGGIGVFKSLQDDGSLLIDSILVADLGSGFVGFGDSSPPSRVSIAGNITANAWATTGIQFSGQAATYVDDSTAASGTAATAVFASFAQPSLNATNTSVTTTDAATLYIANAPLGIGNMSITNPLAFWVDDGLTRLDGGLTATGVINFAAATSLAIPVSSTPTVDSDGEIAYDDTVTDWSTGLIRFFGTEEQGLVSMPIAQFTTPSDGFVVTYNATNDEFELTAKGSGGEWTLASGVVSPNAATTNVSVGTSAGATYGDGTTAIGGQWVHVLETGDASLVAKGSTGAFLHLIDSGGTSNDKTISLEVDAGVATLRSLNDDGTTLIDSAIAVALSTGNIDMDATGYLRIPRGTTAQEPSATDGRMRYDNDTDRFRGTVNTVWKNFSMGADGLVWTAEKTAAYTAVRGEFVAVNLNGAAGNVPITTPASPAKDDIFGVYVSKHDGSHNRRATLTLNGAALLEGSTITNHLDLLVEGEYFILQYSGISSYDWVLVGSFTPEPILTGISASTTQTQPGGTDLREAFNFVLFADTDDAVTIDWDCFAGRMQHVANLSDSRIQLFPKSGDAIDGKGIDNPITLEPDTSVWLIGEDSTNWRSLIPSLQVANPLEDGVLYSGYTNTNDARNKISTSQVFFHDGTDTIFTKDAIGATADSDTVALINNTEAANNAQQYSPAVRWRGQGWKTSSPTASIPVDFRAYVIPVQESSTIPTVNWVLESSVNDQAYVQHFRVESSGDVYVSKDGIGATADEDGFSVVNTTAAAAGAQQYSPAFRLEGQGWKTAATAASQKVEFRAYVVPVQGTNNPTGYLVFESSINDASYGELVRFDSSGRCTFNPNATVAGLNVGSNAGEPSTPVDGDIFYDSSATQIKGRANGAWVNLGGAGGSSEWTLTSGVVHPNSDATNVSIGAATAAAEYHFDVSGTGAGALLSQITWTSTGSVTDTAVSILPTYNQVASTASSIDLLINRTETQLGSGTHYLADFQVAAASRFQVRNDGQMVNWSRSANTSTAFDSLIVRHTTSGDMADGFGGNIEWEYEDSTSGVLSAASISVVRAGSDTDTDMVFNIRTTGSGVHEFLRLDSSGTAQLTDVVASGGGALYRVDNNANDGFSGFRADAEGAGQANLSAFGSTYSSANFDASSGSVWTNSSMTAGLDLKTQAGDMSIYTGGLTSANLRVTFDASGDNTVHKDSIGAVVDEDTFALVNATAAAAGAQQFSPGFRLQGQGWKTDATAASQKVEFLQYVETVQGAAAPTGNWHLQSSINDAAYNDIFNMRSDGFLTQTRFSALTNSVGNTNFFAHQTSGDMADGFGVSFSMTIEDSGAGPNQIASLQAVRAGADNTGDFLIRTMNAGALRTSLQIDTDLGYVQTKFASAAASMGFSAENDATDGSATYRARVDGDVNLYCFGSTFSGSFPADSGALTTDAGISNGFRISVNTGPLTFYTNSLERWEITNGGDTTVTKDSIGETADENTFALVNTSAATSGLDQYSPALRLQGQGWKTAATAASQKAEFRTYVVPEQGTNNPTAYMTFESSINDASYVEHFRIDSTGVVESIAHFQFDQSAHFGTKITAQPSGGPVSATITLSAANHQTLDMSSVTGLLTLTLDMGTGTGICSGTIAIKQHATTAQDITWVAGTNITTGRWMVTEPTWNAITPGDWIVVSWVYDGAAELWLTASDEEQSTFT